MEALVPPPIFSPRLQYTRLGWFGRATALAVAMGCLSVLITAVRLPPSPTGLGTHTELGLAACDFQRRWGIPCPSCGMTTSFAWFVRANFPASLYVQPMGAILAAAAAAVFWAGIYIALTARPVHLLLARGAGGYDLSSRVVWVFFAATMLAWGWKIAIHLGKVDGWTAGH